MSDAHGLEAPREALAQTGLHQERRRTENDYVQGAVPVRIGIPQALDGFGPVAELLDLIENKNESTA